MWRQAMHDPQTQLSELCASYRILKEVSTCVGF